jgi:hypothetical protein
MHLHAVLPVTDTGFLFEEENLPALPLPTPAPLPATTPASTRPPSSNKPPSSVKPPASNKVPASAPELDAEDYTGIFILSKTMNIFMMTFLFLIMYFDFPLALKKRTPLPTFGDISQILLQTLHTVPLRRQEKIYRRALLAVVIFRSFPLSRQLRQRQ